MEMEVGLGLIDEWMESCEMKARRSEKVNNGGNKLLSNQEISSARRECE